MKNVAFLHGFTGSPASFTGLLESLTETCRPFAPTLLGHGGTPASEPPSGVTSFEAEVDRVARSIRGHFNRPTTLIGYSLGARIGLGLLDRRETPRCRRRFDGHGLSVGIPERR